MKTVHFSLVFQRCLCSCFELPHSGRSRTMSTAAMGFLALLSTSWHTTQRLFKDVPQPFSSYAMPHPASPFLRGIAWTIYVSCSLGGLLGLLLFVCFLYQRKANRDAPLHISCLWGGIRGWLLFTCPVPEEGLPGRLLFMCPCSDGGSWGHSSSCVLLLRRVAGAAPLHVSLLGLLLFISPVPKRVAWASPLHVPCLWGGCRANSSSCVLSLRRLPCFLFLGMVTVRPPW